MKFFLSLFTVVIATPLATPLWSSIRGSVEEPLDEMPPTVSSFQLRSVPFSPEVPVTPVTPNVGIGFTRLLEVDALEMAQQNPEKVRVMQGIADAIASDLANLEDALKGLNLLNNTQSLKTPVETKKISAIFKGKYALEYTKAHSDHDADKVKFTGDDKALNLSKKTLKEKEFATTKKIITDKLELLIKKKSPTAKLSGEPVITPVIKVKNPTTDVKQVKSEDVEFTIEFQVDDTDSEGLKKLVFDNDTIILEDTSYFWTIFFAIVGVVVIFGAGFCICSKKTDDEELESEVESEV